MSDAYHFSVDQPINPYYHQKTIDYNQAQIEHVRLEEIIINSGINVVTVPSPIDCQDGVYTANWALVRGKKAVLSSLPSARINEEKHAEKMLSSFGIEIIRLPKELKFSGQGDALACGNLLFCGKGYRSDEKAQELAAKALGYERIQLQTLPQLNKDNQPVINTATGWPDSFFYDIDLALAIIKPATDDQKGLIAYCPEAFTPESRQKIEKLSQVDKITVSYEEATKGFATNLLSTGSVVIMSAKAPKLKADLEKLGLEVITPEINELSKGGGYIRCMTLTLI